MSQVDVTVVIPVSLMANKLQGLTEILDQLISRGIEVIVVHDFQDETTSSQLTTISNSRIDSRSFLLVEGRYGGPGSARNAGLQKATRKYVTFWDSDDLVYMPNFMEFIKEVLKKESDIGIAEFVLKKQEEYKSFPIKGETFSDVYRFLAIYPGLWRYMFKRENIDGLKFINSRMGEDQVFIARALKCSQSIHLFHKPVYEYQVAGEGQLTSNPKNLIYLISSLREMSNIHLSTQDPVKKEFMSLTYWKMFLTLITKRGSGVPKIELLQELKGLRKSNPRLLKSFFLQFITIQNYISLR